MREEVQKIVTVQSVSSPTEDLVSTQPEIVTIIMEYARQSM